MEVHSADAEHSDSPAACANCGDAAVEPGYELPLCSRCRTLLARRPFPVWIKISCVVLFGVLLVAGARSVPALRAGVAFERGREAEKRGDFAHAADYYAEVVDRFPESTEALARLAVTRFRAGQLPEAARVLDRLGGRKTSRKVAAEVNQVIQAFDALLPPNADK
jgi:Tetratricopeptide repeat